MNNMVGGGVGPNGPYGGGVGVGVGGINVNANNPQQQMLAQQMAAQHGGVSLNMTADMQQGNRGPGGVPIGMGGGGGVGGDGGGADLISGPQQQMNNAQMNPNQQHNPQGGLMGPGGMGIRPPQGGVGSGGPQQNAMMIPQQQQQQQQQGPGISLQSGNAGGGAAGGSGTAGTDNQHIMGEYQKQMQLQLMVLLHADKCNRRDSIINPNREKCNVPYCKSMQDVLTHMATCKQSRDCIVQHCISSREILLHYETCSRPDCVICFPFRQSHAYQNNAYGAGNSGPNNVSQN